MTRALALAVVVVVVMGCGDEDAGPSPRIICHNGNCAGPTDPFRDGTMAALEESLALRTEGRTTIDGVELDYIWFRAEQRCVYGHDLSHGQHVPWQTATNLVAAHVRDNAVSAWNSETFFVKIELKRDVGANGELQTLEDAEKIRECGFDVAEVISNAARESGHRVFVMFHGGPDILAALVKMPRWPGTNAGSLAEYRLHAEHHAVLPEGLQADVVSIPVWKVTDGLATQLSDSGKQVLLDMFDVTVETTHTIEQLRPAFVGTNEAPFMRNWLLTVWHGDDGIVRP